MQCTVTIDDELYAQALSLADPGTKPSALIEVCVKAFAQRQSARLLAELGGQMPDLEVPRPPERTVDSLTTVFIRASMGSAPASEP